MKRREAFCSSEVVKSASEVKTNSESGYSQKLNQIIISENNAKGIKLIIKR